MFKLAHPSCFQKETVDLTKLAALPGSYHSLPPQAKLYYLACVTLPSDVSTFSHKTWKQFSKCSQEGYIAYNVTPNPFLLIYTLTQRTVNEMLRLVNTIM